MIVYVLFGEIAYLTCAESPFWQSSSLESGVTRGVTRDIINFESAINVSNHMTIHILIRESWKIHLSYFLEQS